MVKYGPRMRKVGSPIATDASAPAPAAAMNAA
jgi:hypothetical protein